MVDRHIDRVLQVAAKGEAGPCQFLAEGIDEVRLAGGGQAKVLKHVLVVAFSVETDGRAVLETVLQRLHPLLSEPVGVDQGLSGQVGLEVLIEGAAAHLVKGLTNRSGQGEALRVLGSEQGAATGHPAPVGVERGQPVAHPQLLPLLNHFAQDFVTVLVGRVQNLGPVIVHDGLFDLRQAFIFVGFYQVLPSCRADPFHAGVLV